MLETCETLSFLSAVKDREEKERKEKMDFTTNQGHQVVRVKKITQ